MPLLKSDTSTLCIQTLQNQAKRKKIRPFKFGLVYGRTKTMNHTIIDQIVQF